MAQPMVMTKNRSMDTKLCAATVAAVLLLAGCATSRNQAPVEDRSGNARTPNPAAVAVVPPPVDPSLKEAPKPGAENAGKNGFYTVKPGDTLIRIGLENGQNWKDLVKWNALDNPNLIEVGQVLRVLPPGVDPNAASSKPVTMARVETRPLDAKAPGAAASAVPPASAPVAAPAPALPAPAPAPAPPPAPRDGDDDVHWTWPASGPVLAGFDEGKVKGLVVGGKAGDPVLAAADGRVVYAG